MDAFIQWWKRHRIVLLIVISVVCILYAILTRDPWEDGGYSTQFQFPMGYFERQSAQQAKKRFARKSKGELECRRVLEAKFKLPFPTVRLPQFKNHITNQALELDCYNERLRLAVEYNGEQHYRYTPAFHKTRDAFHNQQYRDEMKQKMCQDNGIQLVVVPYWIAHDRIEGFLLEKLRDLGF